MINKMISQKQEDYQKKTVRKVEAQVQQAFLNTLYEQGILSDKVFTLSMRKIAEGE